MTPEAISPIGTVVGTDISPLRAHRFALHKRTLAMGILLTLSGLVGWLANFGIAYAMLPLFIPAIVVIAFQSPPVLGAFLVYGWVILPDMDVPPVGGLPRIPATSFIAAVILGSLAIQRIAKGSISRLCRMSVAFYVGLFALIFVLGYAGIYVHGKWDSVVVRTLAWQKLISCSSMFTCGLLCCRDRKDLHFVLRALPFCFLIYVLYLPFGIYVDFAWNFVIGSSAYAAGLSFGTLNSNTLGQGASVAAVVAAVMLMHSRSRQRDRIAYGALFIVAVSITIASASRQSLLALLVGLAILIARLRPVIGAVLLVGILFTAPAIVQRLNDAAEGQAFLGRFADISKSSEEWSTGSFTDRARELELAMPHLLDRPLAGYGFGGYSLAKDIPDVRSRSDFNESNFLVYLWNDGYFLVGEHNFPVALYLQTGLVGVTAFLVLVISPYFRLRRRNRRLPPEEVNSGYIDDVIVVSLGAAIFVLQNISGGLALGSMGILLFIIGAMVAALAGPRSKAGPSPCSAEILRPCNSSR